MNAARRRPATSASAIVLTAGLVFGCVAVDGGYYGGAVGYGLDYYEPSGSVYGGWGSTYLVAPFREHGREREGEYRAEHGGHEAPHAFRAAPAGRAIPSIPSAPRGGGGRAGGGGGGGHTGGGGRSR